MVLGLYKMVVVVVGLNKMVSGCKLVLVVVECK